MKNEVLFQETKDELAACLNHYSEEISKLMVDMALRKYIRVQVEGVEIAICEPIVRIRKRKNMIIINGYEGLLATAYVRGFARNTGHISFPPALADMPLDALTNGELSQIINLGIQKGLKLHYFKRKDDLPRVTIVLGFLRGVQPQSLLDVGSGRGAFLFPFLREFPDVPVTSLDLLPRRVEMLQAVSTGGVARLTALQGDICAWDAADGSFDVVTLLEVLEHIPDVERAVANAVRLARRYVVVTVPSKPDNNPEHIHLLTKEKLTGLFTQAGCEKLKFGGVNGHLTAVVSLNKGKEL